MNFRVDFVFLMRFFTPPPKIFGKSSVGVRFDDFFFALGTLLLLIRVHSCFKWANFKYKINLIHQELNILKVESVKKADSHQTDLMQFCISAMKNTQISAAFMHIFCA